MIKGELIEPIYEIQEGETPKQYYFFKLFCRFDGSLEDFKKELDGRDKGELFNHYTLEYKPLAPRTFTNISSFNSWTKRKKAYKVSKFDEDFEYADEVEHRRFRKRYDLKEDIEYLALKRISADLKHNDRYTGGQFRDHTQGIRNIQDSRNIDREKPTDYNHTDVTADVDSINEVRMDIDMTSPDIRDRNEMFFKKLFEERE